MEEIKAMKEKEKLSSTNSSIRTVSDVARPTSSGKCVVCARAFFLGC